MMHIRPHRVVAFNYAEDSDNRIHADDVAQQYGFRGGLVPGVADIAYATHPLLDRWGLEWLQRGRYALRLLQPVYHGETVTVSIRERAQDEPLGDRHAGDPASAARECGYQLLLQNEQGTDCAVGDASLTAEPAEPETLPDAADLPETRPDAGVQALPAGKLLGSVRVAAHGDDGRAKLIDKYRDDHSIYADHGVLPPALIPDLANTVLSSNVALGPWIHVASEVQHHRPIPQDAALEMRGQVHDSYLRKGHELAELDLVLIDDRRRALATLRHTAIVRLRPPREQTA